MFDDPDELEPTRVSLSLLERRSFLVRDRHAFARRPDDGGEQGRIVLNRGEEITQLVLLVDDVVREQQTAWPKSREHQVEKPPVVALPRVEEHEVEVARQPGNLLERIAGHDGDNVAEAGARDVGRRGPGARGIELDR